MLFKIFLLPRSFCVLGGKVGMDDFARFASLSAISSPLRFGVGDAAGAGGAAGFGSGDAAAFAPAFPFGPIVS